MFDDLAYLPGIDYFASVTLTDIVSHVYNEYLVNKVNLSQVHIVEHLFLYR